MTAAAPRPSAATPARAWLSALETTAQATRDPARTLARAAGEWAAAYGDAPAVLSDVEQFTFRALAERANRYSRWALAAGLAKGDVVALMMGARPEYFALWLGLTQVGVVVALLNVNLAGPALAHCVEVAGARAAIVAAPFAEICAEAFAGLPLDVWRHGGDVEARRLDLALSDFSGAPLDDGERRATTLSDRALLIFTSGTTGLPKAAAVSHHRVVAWSHWFAGLADMRADDRMYDCLPLCHSVGGVAALPAALVNGGSVVIAEKFSASRFWSEIARWDCTIFQYIGELCRYLVAAPPSPDEKRHRLRLACGNGLSADVWRAFAERFGLAQILEFYASTEGNLTLYNVEGKVGAIGRQPAFLAARDAIVLARFDYEKEAPLRGPNGLCARCGVDEVGEALGRIGREAGQRFEGYTEPAETAKKILRDVFAPGDAWMRTGDLMRRDREGFYYFVDRVGDTFRWKGENVATSEVAAALSAAPGVKEAVVYGVAVPNADGKAGMAALTIAGAPDLAGIARAASALPRYARPLFLRLTPALEATATFKPVKRALAAEGFDPAKVADPLYVYDAEREIYGTLDAKRYAAIASGDARL
ncbi:MAG: long-chain-acyl-CoA synthetase [Roseiarcus sp.]|jgi:fatty-acyl-CoA synthase